MDKIFIPLLAMVVVVLQTTLIPQIAIAGIAPDLIFLFVIFLALQRQTTIGIWFAFCLGLLQDISGGGILGLNALLLLGLAYLALYLRQKFFQENFISQILIILLFTILHQFLAFFWLNTLLHTQFVFGQCITRALGMSLYHAVVGPVVFVGLRQFIRNDELHRNLIKTSGGRSHLSGPERMG
jgi:rod shape-determining protein MreD